MGSKEDALFTQERVITISGTAGQCIKCTNFVLAKLDEQEEVAPFLNRGTTYSSPLQRGFMGFGRGSGRGGPGGRTGALLGRGRGRGSLTGGRGDEEQEPEATVTTSMVISNDLVGNIFGKHGSTMREIISLSGAKVVVSGR